MKALFLALALFLSGCATKSHVIPPSTVEVRGSISTIRSSTNNAQVSNDETIEAVTAAQLNAMAIRQKLELLKANYPH